MLLGLDVTMEFPRGPYFHKNDDIRPPLNGFTSVGTALCVLIAVERAPQAAKLVRSVLAACVVVIGTNVLRKKPGPKDRGYLPA